MLVHADRGREHARADVAHVGELEEALHRAVLAERAVQDGEDDIDLAEDGGDRPASSTCSWGPSDGRRQHDLRAGRGGHLGEPARAISQTVGSSEARTQRPSG